MSNITQGRPARWVGLFKYLVLTGVSLKLFALGASSGNGVLMLFSILAATVFGICLLVSILEALIQ